MATYPPQFSAPMSDISVPNYGQSNPIDLTTDEDEDNGGASFINARDSKRMRLDDPTPPDACNSSQGNSALGLYFPVANHAALAQQSSPVQLAPSQQVYDIPRPAQTTPVHTTFSAYQLVSPRSNTPHSSQGSPWNPSVSATHTPMPIRRSTNPNVIDLTGSPSPPPHQSPPIFNSLPPGFPPKTPVCIGELTVTALVLYPVSYLHPLEHSGYDSEWAPIRLQYERTVNKTGNVDTIHIRSPNVRGPSGDHVPGDAFGVVEQKVSTSLGPMLSKGLIRLDGRVRRGMPNLPILPLRMLVFTPSGNVPVVGNYLRQCSLLLQHPSPPHDPQRFASYHYLNPHSSTPNPNRESFSPIQNRAISQPQIPPRWSAGTYASKSVDVQRNQVDELFKSLKSGDELSETEPPFEVATDLYPHQKKALTFLLEREQERLGPEQKPSSLWQERKNASQRRPPTWYHVVTQKEVSEAPQEPKSAILADDMGLGKTLTCVALIASTMESATSFSATPIAPVEPPPPRMDEEPALSASHFAGSVWGVNFGSEFSAMASSSTKGKAKAMRLQDKLEAEYIRACRIKAKSRATLIICPLSTVANWEDQLREHWRGEVSVIGGSGTLTPAPTTPAPGTPTLQPTASFFSNQGSSWTSSRTDSKATGRIREGKPLRVYVYHGNARRPDPAFLADFDAVITTYATLATEFSKQSRSTANAEAEEDDGEASSDPGNLDSDDRMASTSQPRRPPLKRKKTALGALGNDVTSALQSVHWFRVVLDEAHSIKETTTVASRASCDLWADRRLCLTGTPVQNKLDDVFALIKFLRLDPLDEKAVWTEFIGTPVKYGQPLGVARLQTIMKCITLRRTKETKAQDGKKILSLPPRKDELRYLKFEPQEQQIYDEYFNESKAEFTELSHKNEVMKHYVGILQKILRLRQICDHFELVKGKGLGEGSSQDSAASYEEVVAAIDQEGLNAIRAAAVYALLRESGTTQCGECGVELSSTSDPAPNDMECDQPTQPKRGRKVKTSVSRAPTRANSPSSPRPVLTRCQHLFCFACYQQCTYPGWPHVPSDSKRACSACQTDLGPQDAIEIKPDCTVETGPKKKSPRKEKRQKGISLEDFHPSTKIKALLGDLVELSKTNPYSSNYCSDSVEVQTVDGQGNAIDDGIVKTVVFSQWTSMLDKVEDALEVAGIRYDRLDGTMKRDERSRAMDALKYDRACEVLLVSLKAGGVGLNLTAAQRVYLMDPYWNPAVENQAVDRIHRLGQTKPVTTVRFIIENTIESRLLEVQRKKTALANMTLGINFSKAEMLQRRLEELNQLFSS